MSKPQIKERGLRKSPAKASRQLETLSRRKLTNVHQESTQRGSSDVPGPGTEPVRMTAVGLLMETCKLLPVTAALFLFYSQSSISFTSLGQCNACKLPSNCDGGDEQRKKPCQYLAPEPEDDFVDKQLPMRLFWNLSR
ncbi:hypothetical protein LEMLEM_LOCUS24584 [Lemmus lemmus]